MRTAHSNRLRRAADVQIDLFDDRYVILARARAFLADARLDAARHELVALRERYPHDATIARELARAQALLGRFSEIDWLGADERAPALLALAREIELEPRECGAPSGRLLSASLGALLRAALYARVAQHLSDTEGPLGLLEGWPPAFYWLAAGALDDAQASISLALRGERRARWLALAGDVALARVEAVEARRLYLQAMLLDPFDVRFEAVIDDDVRCLPDLAKNEFGILEEPAAWAAPVGVLTDTLPARLPGMASGEERAANGAGWSAAQFDGLGRARAFLDALDRAGSGSAADRSHVIEARRTMKRLAPALFEAYMERLAGR